MVESEVGVSVTATLQKPTVAGMAVLSGFIGMVSLGATRTAKVILPPASGNLPRSSQVVFATEVCAQATKAKAKAMVRISKAWITLMCAIFLSR
jgi:hypothetical protein